MRKTLYAIFCLLFLQHNDVLAQLRVNVGPDITRCSVGFEFPELFLGDSLSVTGGIPPYRYEWKNLDFLAISHYLDSSTSMHPKLIGEPYRSDSVLMVLQVTDSTGLSASDTLRINFSYLAMMIPVEGYYSKTTEDTIMLVPRVKSQYVPGGAKAPATFSWRPSVGLIDSTEEYPICWVKTNTKYTLTITDRFGCVLQPHDHYVRVEKLGLEDQAAHIKPLIYPNPVSNGIVEIRTSEQLNGLTFSLYDYQGRKVRQLLLNNPVIKLNTTGLAAGMYNYRISGTQVLHSGKLMIN